MPKPSATKMTGRTKRVNPTLDQQGPRNDPTCGSFQDGANIYLLADVKRGSNMLSQFSPIALYWVVTAGFLVLGLIVGLLARSGAIALSRLGMIAIGGALLAILILAFAGGNANNEIEVLFTLPFGQLTLVDLFVGFVLSAVIIFAVERTMLMAVAMTIPVFLLGNVWTAIWLAFRLPLILERFRGNPPAAVQEPAQSPAEAVAERSGDGAGVDRAG
jgi:hypothetical protein